MSIIDRHLCHIAIIGLLMAGPRVSAQERLPVEEPPVPVIMVCPFHEDSLRRAYEAGSLTSMQGPEVHGDSIQAALLTETTALNSSFSKSFIVMFILLAGMGLMNVITVRVAYRLKEEVRALHLRQATPPSTPTSASMIESAVVEPKSPKRTRSRRTRSRSTRKPRSRS